MKHNEKKDTKKIYLVSTVYLRCAQDTAQYTKSRDIYKYIVTFEKKATKEIYLLSIMYRRYAQDAAQYIKS